MKKYIPVVLLALAITTCSKKVEDLGNFSPVPDVDKISDEVQTEIYDPRVDILFVVDNSGSMKSHQDNMSLNIPLFLKAFLTNNTLEYHMGVITTDSGMLAGEPNYIDNMTEDGPEKLAANLQVGIEGGFSEMMFDPVAEALTPPLSEDENLGFLREGAYLAIVFLTDAEDQSAQFTNKELYKLLLSIKKDEAYKILGYGVIIPTKTVYPNDCPRDEGTPPRKVEAFLKMTATTPKNVMEICAPDFGSRLGQLGKDLVDRISRVIVLKRAPDVSTIVVSYGTQIIPQDEVYGWSFESFRNAVVIGEKVQWDRTQPPGTVMKIEYKPARY